MIRDRDHLPEGTCVAARASGFRADPSCRQRPLAVKEVDVVWVFDVPAGTPPATARQVLGGPKTFHDRVAEANALIALAFARRLVGCPASRVTGRHVMRYGET